MGLLQNTIQVKVTPRNAKDVRQSMDNENLKLGELINLPVEKLNTNSKKKVNVECDNCSSLGQIAYEKYVKNTLRNEGKYHCKACSNIKRKQTIQDKYGVDNVAHVEQIQEKKKKTNLKKYGVEHSFQANSVREKRRKTNIKKYGHPEHLKAQEIIDKRKKTVLARYGVSHYSKTKKFRKKSQKTWASKQIEIMKGYGAIDPIHNEDDSYNCVCPKEGHRYNITLARMYQRHVIQKRDNCCTICHPYDACGTSLAEQEISKYLNFLGVEHSKNNRQIIGPMEIDVFCPEQRVAIEYNGMPWHSTKFKDPDYHIRKREACEDAGVTLLSIWDYQWKNKRAACKDLIIRNVLPEILVKGKIHNTEILAKDVAVPWFLLNDVLYASESEKIQYFAGTDEHGDILISFAYSVKNDQIIINRWTIKNNIRVSTKDIENVLNEIAKRHNASKINARVYMDTGLAYNIANIKKFTYVGDTKNYSYMIAGNIESRYPYKKDKLLKKNLVLPGETEEECMNRLGHYRVYDSGQQKWVWEAEVQE